MVTCTSDITVRLIQSVGGDHMVVAAAKVSTSGEEAEEFAKVEASEENYGLIRYLMKMRHGCYDSNTEVLTNEGWKFWPDITGNELFATLSKDEAIEYQAAERVVHKAINGPMVSIKTAHVDMLVTPDHNMLAARRTYDGFVDYKLGPAKDFLTASHRIKMGGGEWTGQPVNCPMALLGFFIGDGHAGGSVSFHLKKPRKIEYLKRTAAEAGIAVSTQKNDKYGLLACREFSCLARQCYSSDRQKQIPRHLLQGTKEELEALFNGMMAADGSYSAQGRMTYTTTSRILADQFQELCVKIGMAATLARREQDDASRFGDQPVYHLNIFKTRKVNPRIGWTTDVRKREVRIVNYNGTVHCVTVPNGTLYVRRNGKPAWCGNTPFEHNSMTFFVHAPIFVWREWHRHRIGFCLAGDTQIWADRQHPIHGRTLRKMPLAELCNRWNNGVTDSLGRTRHLPSVKAQTLRVLNEDTHLFECGQIENVFESGVKELFLVQTDDHRGYSIRCSSDHRVLTPYGWAKVSELSERDCIYVNGKRNANDVSVPPSLRRGIGAWTSMQRTRRIAPVDTCYMCECQFVRDELTLDHVIPVVTDITRALDLSNLRPACIKCHREKSSKEQQLADRNIVAGSKLVRLQRKPYRVSEEMTYDVTMKDPWHNFVANGIVVHNSYNEESGRYKKLEPVFWVPRPDRDMKPVENFKPARPKFEPLDIDAHGRLIERMKRSYELSYSTYEESLADGVAKEVARAVLPVGIYSSCWVTTNARALMHFLSLRIHDPNALFVSYPQAEIQEAARVAAIFMETGWPLTYRAFKECNSVAP